MSSFLNAQHLKVMVGQEHPLHEAWANFYGAELLTRGMFLLPFAIEQFYPQTQTSEWELAVVRMIISCSDLRTGPCAEFSPQDFASRFHLSLRQIRRKFKTMVEKDLVIITPCYDDNGRKTKLRNYDCNPFLDKIFACICADDDWQQQQDELLESIGIAEDIDDLSMLSILNDELLSDVDDLDAASSAQSYIFSVSTNEERTSMSSSVADIIGTSMSSSATDSSERSDMSSSSSSNLRTSMSSSATDITGTSMSSEQNELRTAISTSYARAHVSNSNSINTSINTLQSVSNSNSNSKHNTSDFLDAEDDTTWMADSCLDQPSAFEELALADCNTPTELVRLQNDEQARFELFIQDAIEQAAQADNDSILPTEPVGQPQEKVLEAFEQSSKANEQVYQADEQAEIACQQIQQQEQLQHQSFSPTESLNHVAFPEQTSSDNPEPQLVLPEHSKATLYHISNKLHDASLNSSRTRARTLYNQLVSINQVADEYSMSNPDLYFSDLMLTVKEHIAHRRFKSRNHDGRPNGMPLFFHELKQRIDDQIAAVDAMRLDGDYLRMYQEQRTLAATLDTQDDAQSDHGIQVNSSEEVVPEFIRLSNAAKKIGQISFTDAEIVAHAQRLRIPMSDEEAQQMLDQTAADLLREQLTTAVHQGLYYEIVDA